MNAEEFTSDSDKLEMVEEVISEKVGGKFSFENWGNTIQSNYWNEDSVVNSVLSWIGALGAIYTLGTNDAKTIHNDKVLGITGAAL